MKTCSVEGCGRPVRARGYCDMHYQRFKKTGEPGGPEPMLLYDKSWSRHQLYRTWDNMLRRCDPERANGYAREYYIAKGIEVCDRWQDPEHGFTNFLEDVGPRPEPCEASNWLPYSLDRFPNRHGNYCPTNVRWATKKEQSENRDHREITHCPQGHEYTEENTRTNPNGSRSCRKCLRERKRADYRRKRQQQQEFALAA